MSTFKALLISAFGLLSLTLTANASAEPYSKAMTNFKQAAESQAFFNTAYGYAIFPTVGKGGFGIGAAYGEGRVYRGGQLTGESTLTQVSIGFQIGGQAYSEIIFFKNAEAYNAFTSGSFEFSAQASAVALNAGASAQVGTTGNSANAGQSGGNQSTKAAYVNGMAIFTSAKGGLMYEAAIAGQSFSFKPK
ncbi:YSC84-related protein [Shewanella sp. SR44-3]|uniref:lipid-binding SYLF domain-containing protein n=1 Tax=unclassified Shewanella TaxID=196818 RepID=UPI0015FC47E6|nr:lipid-binding SYLF domain-containing protein [Shewanella sp. SR44-3]MBB1269377.1 lipid-binding SYLF domain-containing protein [Shewanella sp. SR44-3]